MAPPKRITVHHEGKEFYGSTLEDSLRQMRNIQEYHQRGKKWADIGYHYVIDRLGNIFEGRPLTIQGAHAGERNKRGETPNQANIGISLLGNFDSQQITPAQEKALRQLVSYLETTYGIPNSEVYTHNEIRQKFNVGATGCPGKHLSSVVVDIRRNGALSKPSAASSRAGG
jgi:N-acetyl-anhydromuramyl-L-alanine amidase AmpD